MAAANQYRAKAWECLSLAECMNDPEERAEIVRFARMWMNLAEPSDEARGSYEFPREAEKNSKLNLPFLQNELRKIYGDVLRKPVPSQLTSLLHRLEHQPRL
jgi:hypothetical protein